MKVLLSYSDIVRSGNTKLITQVRTEMAILAETIGILPTARKYEIDWRTVKKWYTRWKHGDLLEDQSKRPHHIPRKMEPYWIMLIVDKAQQEILRLSIQRARVSKPIRISAAWLKKTYRIPYTEKTILKVLHMHNLKVVKRQKPKRNTDDTVFKRKQLLDPWYYWQVDIKELRDIHGYAYWISRLQFPKYQITARDIRTGTLFIGFLYQKSATNSALFIDTLLAHLRTCGIDTKQVHIQTDHGSEFVTPMNCDHASPFTVMAMMKYGATHTVIPIGQKNWQADVESSHRLIEDEFYQPHRAKSYDSFLAAANRYVHHFNTERHNSYKGASPLGILEQSDHPTYRSSMFDWKIPLCDRLLTAKKRGEMAGWYEKARATRLQADIRLSLRIPFQLPSLPNTECISNYDPRAA